MKQSLLTFFLIHVVTLGAKAQFTDDFSDGDFTASPTWTGNTTEFMVNGSEELQLNNTIAATSYLSSAFTAASIDNFEWRFFVRMNFAPSSSNFARVYIVSDQSNVTSPLNGYYLQFGEAGTLDAIHLYQQTGGTSTLICSGTAASIAAAFQVSVRVLRDNAGNWQLFADYTGGTNYTLEATGTEATYSSSAHIGVMSTYTVSNATDVYFDSFYMGPIIVDTTPPDAFSATPTSATQVDILFNEPMDQTTVETEANYTCNNGIGVPTSAVRDGSNFALVHLTFASPFTILTNYSVIINNVDDVALNTLLADTVSFTYALSGTAGWRDVVINELMPDPSPVIGLPDAEYIELYNAGTSIYDLNGWQLSDATSTTTLGTYLLNPGSYVILCSAANAPLFSSFGSTLPCTLPSLNNDTDELTLTNGVSVVDEVTYFDTWYLDDTKDDGGWSLELINPDLPCTNSFNWIASTHFNGGTPGFLNTVYDTVSDNTPPQVISVDALGATQLQVNFNETLDSTTVPTALYVVTGGPAVSSAQNISPAYTSILLTLATPLDSGIVYQMVITNVNDCSGNTMINNGNVVLPFQALGGEIIINEVLFDPATGGNDYVEIVNTSSKALSLKDWTLANYDNDTISDNTLISSVSHVLLPGEYRVMCIDQSDLVADFPNAVNVLLMASLPTYNNDSGTVYLVNNLNKVMDKFSYTSDMHFALLNNTENVSLERIRFDSPTQDAGNWHSASEASGFGTPGYLNSQYQDGTGDDGAVSVVPEIFSPDNDGYNDVVTIEYTFGEAGWVGNCQIFDTHGRLIKEIAKNELLGATGRITWDGINEKREKAAVGIYIIYFEVFDLQGKVKKYKRSCVLATKFD